MGINTIEKSENLVFRPLDEQSTQDVYYQLVLATLEGPNGVGKTSIWRQAINILQAVHSINFKENQAVPPIKGMAEPPGLLVDDNRADTWRSLTKEGKSKDKLVDEIALKDPYFQARLFLWGRRMVEYDARLNFPFLDSTNWLKPDSLILRPGQRFPDSLENLGRSRIAIFLKDRGTGSTLRYQGRDPNVGGKVVGLVDKLYRTGFLIKEAMTILVMPAEDGALRDGEHRDRERDQFTENGDVASYRSIKQHEGMFTRGIVEIVNDPTGRQNRISTSACLVATLLYALEKEKLGLLSIRRNEIMHLDFPLRDALDRLEEVGTPGMSYVSLAVMKDLGSQGKWYSSGDVNIRLPRTGVDLMIR